MFLFPVAHSENVWCLALHKIRPFLSVPKDNIIAASFRAVMFENVDCGLVSDQPPKIKFTEQSKCHWTTSARNTHNEM